MFWVPEAIFDLHQSRGAFILKKPYGPCYTTAVWLNMWGNHMPGGGLRALSCFILAAERTINEYSKAAIFILNPPNKLAHNSAQRIVIVCIFPPYSAIIEWLHNSYLDLSQQERHLPFTTI